MKKMFLCLVAVAAMALGLTSCNQNPGTIQVKYGFISADNGGITNGVLNAYYLTNKDLYDAFDVAFKSESGYNATGIGECELLNQDKVGHEVLVFNLAVKGWGNVPSDFDLPADQTERTFCVMYRFVGDSKTTEWKTAWKYTFPESKTSDSNE